MKRNTRALIAGLSAVFLGSIISLVPRKNATGSTPLPVTVKSSSPVNATTQSVGSSNTSAMPLHMRDIPAHNAFAHFQGCTVPASTHDCSVKITVPSGRELVIETVSVGAALNSGERAVVTMEFTTRGISTNVLTLPLTFAGSFSTESPPDEYAITQPLRVYADPNTTVELDATISDSAGGAGFHFEVSGYLVRCGSGGCSVP
jgi:hypothetical protein